MYNINNIYFFTILITDILCYSIYYVFAKLPELCQVWPTYAENFSFY